MGTDAEMETTNPEMQAVEEVIEEEELEELEDDEEEDDAEDGEAAETRFETRNPLDGDVRVEMVELLNQHLADLSDLYSQTKQAHWNVRGVHFQALHVLFDDVAASIHPLVDELAERVNTLGGYAYGTIRMGAEASRLEPFPTDVTEGMAMVDIVAARWAAYSALLREGIDDADDADDDLTEDLLTEIGRTVEKGLWFIEAHMQS